MLATPIVRGKKVYTHQVWLEIGNEPSSASKLFTSENQAMFFARGSEFSLMMLGISNGIEKIEIAPIDLIIVD